MISVGRSKLLRAAILACLVVGALVFVNFVHFSRESLLAQDIQNFGHVLVFAIIAVVVFAAVGLVEGGKDGDRRKYWLSGAILVALGILSEALQISTARDADPGDLFRDFVGAYVGLTACALYSWANQARRAERRPSPTGLVMASLLALAGLAIAAGPIAMGLVANLKRISSFPDLLPKSALYVNRYIEADSIRLVADSNEAPASPFIRCVFTSDLFPGLIVADPVSDWQYYRYLRLHYRLAGSEAQEFFLLVAICDGADEEPLYRYDLPLKAGEHELRVDLASAQEWSSQGAPFRCVDRLYIKTPKVDSVITLDIFELYLDP